MSITGLDFRIQAVEAKVFRNGDDRMAGTETREIKHDRNGNAKGHLLINGKVAPLIFVYGVAPVDHYCKVGTSCAVPNNTLR